MRKILAMCLCLSAFSFCVIPYVKLSDELSVKQVYYRAGRFYMVETTVKNTADNAIDLKMVCDVDGEEKIYNFRVMPGAEHIPIVEKILKPFGGARVYCEYFKR